MVHADAQLPCRAGERGGLTEYDAVFKYPWVLPIRRGREDRLLARASGRSDHSIRGGGGVRIGAARHEREQTHDREGQESLHDGVDPEHR